MRNILPQQGKDKGCSTNDLKNSKATGDKLNCTHSSHYVRELFRLPWNIAWIYVTGICQDALHHVTKQTPITTTRYRCPPLKIAQIQDTDRQHQMLLKVWSSKASAFVSREAKQPQLWWLPVKLNILPPSSSAYVYPKELDTVFTCKPTRRCLPQLFSKSKWVFKPWRKTTEYLEMNGVNPKWQRTAVFQGSGRTLWCSNGETLPLQICANHTRSKSELWSKS